MPNSPSPSHLNGALLAWFGVILLAPDALLVRLSGVEGFALVFWRSLLMGLTVLGCWLIFSRKTLLADLQALSSWSGVMLVITFAVNSITFALGITMTSATVVLTGVATMPLFTALISIPLLGERVGRLTWVIILVCMGGVMLVITSGNQATSAPQGSVLVGGLLGVLTAVGLAISMVLKRREPRLPIMLSTGLAVLIAVGVAFVFLPQGVPPLPTNTGALVALLVMSIIVLPASFLSLMVAPKYTSATTVGLIMLTESIMGPVWVWVGVGETPSPMMIFGAAIVLSSLCVYFMIGEKEVTPSASQLHRNAP